MSRGCLGGSAGEASDFGSGHDLEVLGASPASGSVLTARILEPALDSVSPSLCPSLTRSLACFLSLSLSKINKNLETLRCFSHKSTVGSAAVDWETVEATRPLLCPLVPGGGCDALTADQGGRLSCSGRDLGAPRG